MFHLVNRCFCLSGISLISESVSHTDVRSRTPLWQISESNDLYCIRSLYAWLLYPRNIKTFCGRSLEKSRDQFFFENSSFFLQKNAFFYWFSAGMFLSVMALKLSFFNLRGRIKKNSQIWKENLISFRKMCVCWYFINLYRSNRKCSKSRIRRKFLNSNFQGIRQKFWYSRNRLYGKIYGPEK